MEKVRESLGSLKKDYESRDSSIALVDEGASFKLNVKSEHAPIAQQVVTQTDLSKTLMETLAVIAFKYPIKQSDLIKIRTNKAYDHLNQLEEMGYITRQKYGRTKLIKLAPKFFEYFDLPSEEAKQAFLKFVPPEILNEAEQVMETFAQNLGVKVIHVDASAEFLHHLAGVTDPEQKRKIIGREFVEVFQRESAKLSQAKWLAQGTIYPDVIESAGGKNKKAHTIKSHHNVGGLPDTMHLKLLEPLRELFKDEVRELGVQLGLPPAMVYRHPFPGPGLGVRILGEVKKEYADLLRRADVIFMEELNATKDENGLSWYAKTSQAFVVFLPVKSVGVMGDGRTYEWVVSLRAVQTQDFMTAHWAHLPYELLGRVSNRIINEVRGINRVVYDISGKPPATIEWE